jgi:hypothetical protein
MIRPSGVCVLACAGDLLGQLVGVSFALPGRVP